MPDVYVTNKEFERVYNAVGKWITAEEYEEITGEPYE